MRVLTREAKDVDSRFAQADIPLRHAPLRRYPDIFSAMILRAMFRNIPAGDGIVHVHNHHDALTAIIARKLSRRQDIRIVYTRHRAQRAGDGWLHRLIYRNIDRFIFVSEFSRRRFLAAWPDGEAPIADSRWSVAYNSLPSDETEVAPEPSRGPVTAMYLGGIKPGKGLETLIDALSILNDVKLRLRIVGTGDPDYVDAIRRRAQRRGVMERIDWTRRAPDPHTLIRDVHFGVFPAVEPEAFGMSNLEFMAVGRPQISTLTGGQKEFLTPGKDALEVNPADAASLSEAMRRLATDPDTRQRMGAAAFETFRRRFDWSRFIARLRHIYTS